MGTRDSFNKNCSNIIKFILNEDKAFFHYDTEFTELEYSKLIEEVTNSVADSIKIDIASKQLIMKYSSFLLGTISRTKLLASETVESLQKKYLGQKLTFRKIKDAQTLNNLLLNAFNSCNKESFEVIKAVALNKECSFDTSSTMIRWLIKNNILSSVDTSKILKLLEDGKDIIECLVEEKIEPRCKYCGSVYAINKTSIKMDGCRKCSKAKLIVVNNKEIADKKEAKNNVIKSIAQIEQRISKYKDAGTEEGTDSYQFIMYETYKNTIESNLSNIENLDISMLKDNEVTKVTQGLKELKIRLEKMEEMLNEPVKE